jgi:hypothetical protein
MGVLDLSRNTLKRLSGGLCPGFWRFNRSTRLKRLEFLACRAVSSGRDYADWGVMTQSSATHWRRATAVALVGGLSLALAGCGMSSITSGLGGGMFGGKSSTIADNSGGVSEEQLLSAAKADNSAPGATVTGGINPGCPRLTAKPSDNNITFYEPGRTGDGLAIMHRGEITKTARECRVEAGRVTVKYGFSGRVLLGPRGQGGTVTLPINVMVTDGSNTKVAADAMKIDVAVALDKPIGYFSAVREVSFPVAEGTRPGEYELFVSFDRAAVPGAG